MEKNINNLKASEKISSFVDKVPNSISEQTKNKSSTLLVKIHFFI